MLSPADALFCTFTFLLCFFLFPFIGRSFVEALDRLERKWGDMFPKVFRSITVDNGVEFADYEGLERSVLRDGEKRTFLFYCHPYSSCIHDFVMPCFPFTVSISQCPKVPRSFTSSGRFSMLSPADWERGTNENSNRLIRRHIPKGEDFEEKQDKDIEYIENWINNYPRGILGFKTSAQLFEEEIKNLA